ncbi:hypothetical protein PR048_021078 [Dryococelus australis]|uniref:Uncharacterized protein n=1 Tax=Dryococelus australis TaxID=614101 RepID=A0ABQ9GX78_9NEOP|nr:hypothetical protein PR048_021078 [Dryococelus australis]
MPLVDGFSQISPIFPALALRRLSALIGSQDVVAESRRSHSTSLLGCLCPLHLSSTPNISGSRGICSYHEVLFFLGDLDAAISTRSGRATPERLKRNICNLHSSKMNLERRLPGAAVSCPVWLQLPLLPQCGTSCCQLRDRELSLCGISVLWRFEELANKSSALMRVKRSGDEAWVEYMAKETRILRENPRASGITC